MKARLLTALLVMGIISSGCRPHASEPPPLLEPQQWDGYQTQFITPEGRIIDRGNGEISHSEGQGYGMLLAAAAADRHRFENIWSWTQQQLQRPDGLFSWRWEQGRVTSPNNASDGDILIAWALLSGYQRWGESQWRSEALRILTSINQHLVVPGPFGPLLLPGIHGFVSAKGTTINLSYWVFPALHLFNEVDQQGPWLALIASGHRLLQQGRFSNAQLPADWIDITTNGVELSHKYPPPLWLRCPAHPPLSMLEPQCPLHPVACGKTILAPKPTERLGRSGHRQTG